MNKEGRAGEGMKSRGMTDNGVLLVGVAWVLSRPANGIAKGGYPPPLPPLSHWPRLGRLA
jgi:hypothetical protein